MVDKTTESVAKYKLVEEPSSSGHEMYYCLYERIRVSKPGLIFSSYGWEWKLICAYDTQEQAEAYIERKRKYEAAKANPRVVGYY